MTDTLKSHTDFKTIRAVKGGDLSRQTASASRLKPRKIAPLQDTCRLLLSVDKRNAIYAVKVTGVL